MYRACDALLPPGLLSAARLPLAALFPAAARARGALPAASLMLAAAVTDVLDGWCARRWSMATPTGAAIDAVADKVFVGSAIASLVAGERLGAAEALLLAVREAAELPLSVWYVATGRPQIANDVDCPRSNAVGKLATTLQLVTLAAAALGVPRAARRALVAATALVGGAAAVSYVRRELRRAAARAPVAEEPERCSNAPRALSSGAAEATSSGLAGSAAAVAAAR